jgi:hypothetical protein
VSVEGRTLWLLRSSPLDMRDLLWAKFWTGTVPLLVLALSIVGATDALLGVTPFIFAVSLLPIIFITFAVAGMAIGFGTLYPRFDTESPAQIPTSFGGLLFMMASVAVIVCVVLLEARPVYAYLSAYASGRPAAPMDVAGRAAARRGALPRGDVRPHPGRAPATRDAGALVPPRARPHRPAPAPSEHSFVRRDRRRHHRPRGRLQAPRRPPGRARDRAREGARRGPPPDRQQQRRAARGALLQARLAQGPASPCRASGR